MIIKKIFGIIVLSILLICPLASRANVKDERLADEKLAIEASKTWLNLIDGEKYIDSWESAAEYFKNRITKEQWIKLIPSVRNPLGKLITREIKSIEFKTALPGAPDGQYYVIQYNTSFRKKKSAIETITLMLDKDKKWRISGYFIK